MKDCPHRSKVAQGMELTDEEALEHFDSCYSGAEASERLEAWKAMRTDAHRGRYCFEADHARKLDELLRDRMRLQNRLTGETAALDDLVVVWNRTLLDPKMVLPNEVRHRIEVRHRN